MLSDKDKTENIEKSFRYWKKRLEENPHEQWIQGKFNKMGSERKAFFAQCKTEAAKKLIKSLNGKRFVCFTGGITQADEIGKERAIHGKKTKKHNESTLYKFNNKEINDVYLNKMGNEGLNLTDIEVVIIIQLGTGKDDNLSVIQKGGRAMRSMYPEIYILYFKNTKDEEWLNKALEEYDKKWVKTLVI